MKNAKEQREIFLFGRSTFIETDSKKRSVKIIYGEKYRTKHREVYLTLNDYNPAALSGEPCDIVTMDDNKAVYGKNKKPATFEQLKYDTLRKFVNETAKPNRLGLKGYGQYTPSARSADSTIDRIDFKNCCEDLSWFYPEPEDSYKWSSAFEKRFNLPAHEKKVIVAEGERYVMGYDETDQSELLDGIMNYYRKEALNAKKAQSANCR